MKIQKIKKFIKNNKLNIWLLGVFFIIIIIIFFGINYYIPYDGSHFYYMSQILEGNIDWKNWNTARGLTFPLYISLMTKIFGKTEFGIKMTMFFPFFIMQCLFIWILIKYLKNKNLSIKKDFYKYFFIYLIFIGFNVIMLGYSNNLLTEILAPLLFIINILLSCKWFALDYNKGIKKYSYAIYLTLIGIICFQLKQTYLFISIVPFMLAAFGRIIKNFKLKNVIYSVLIIGISTFLVFQTNRLWNSYVRSKLSTETLKIYSLSYAYNSSLNNALTHTLGREYKAIEEVDIILLNKIGVSDEDKEKIMNFIDNNKRNAFSIYEINDNNKTYYELFYHENGVNFKISLQFLLTQIIKHPRIIFKIYWENFCYISGFLDFKNENSNYGFYSNENSSLASFPLTSSGGVWWQHYYNDEVRSYDDLAINSTLSYFSSNKVNKINYIYAKSSFGLYSILYMICMILIPILGIYYFIRFIIKKDMYNLVLLVIYLSSFIHLCFRIVNGSFVDRYMYPYYLLSLFGFIIILVNFVTNNKKKSIN